MIASPRFAWIFFVGLILPLRADLIVSPEGKGGAYKTVQEAVFAAPAGASPTNPSVIRIAPGTYKGQLYIQREKRFLKLVGENPSNTILTFDLQANMTNASGKPIGTFNTPSVTVDADDFTAENLTFENSAGPVGQALAIRVDGDRAVFRNCRFLGWQDTILLNRGRQYFKDCEIRGHCDFIFGAATAWFEKCRIHCLGKGYITAASTPPETPFGFVFHDCSITGEPGVKSYLGRPWRDYASTVFLNCSLSGVIRPEGWNDWKKTQAHTTARYAEYNSTGEGADPAARESWAKQLNKREAEVITLETVLGGADRWDPRAGEKPPVP